MGRLHARAGMVAAAFAIALVAGLFTATITAFAAEGADQLATGGIAAQDVSAQANDGLNPGEVGTDGDWDYLVLPNGDARIMFYMGSSQTVEFPSTVSERTVTELDCTLGFSDIRKVVIPATVTKIYGLNAKKHKDDEYDNPYRNIGILVHDEKTGQDTFKGTLLSFEVANGNKEFKSVKGVLLNKAGTKLYAYPDGKTGKYTIPSSVKSIGRYAFSYSSAKNITIPGSMKTIGSYAFAFTNANSFTIKKGVKTIGPNAFANMGKATSIKLPSSVRTVSRYAFAYAEKLSKIKLNKGLKTIGAEAFEGTLIKTITIPKTVKKIKQSETYTEYGYKDTVMGHPFCYCRKLTSIKVAKGNKKYASVKGVLFNKKKTVLLAYPTNKKGAKYKVPKKVKAIGSCAFYYNKKLATVVLPKKLKTIGTWAFFFSKMTSLTIPASVKSIGQEAFAGCEKLVITNKSKIGNTSGVFFGAKEVK